tara:strand:+ start:1830 stop:5645 length:3816 start_codon:yes stop_codon:yes gene_type:complete
MAVDFQPTQFQPVTLYDLPSIGFSQILEGEATAAGFLSGVSESTGIGSSTLTPTERETLVDGFKQEKGLTGLGGALADIATNPWVWLSFVATPGAATALKKGAGGIFNVAPKYHAFIRENAPFLVGWNFLTANQALRKTGLLDTFRKVSEGRNKHLSLFEEMTIPAKEQVLQELNKRGIRVTSLDPEKAPLKHRPFMQKLDMAIHGRLQGLDKHKTETVIKSLKAKDAKYEIEWLEPDPQYLVQTRKRIITADSMEAAELWVRQNHQDGNRYMSHTIKEIEKPGLDFEFGEQVTEAIMDARIVDEVINSAGAEPLVQAYRNYYNRAGALQFLDDAKVGNMTDEQLARVFNDADALEEAVDANKIANLWRSAEQRKSAGGDNLDDLFSVAENRSDNPAMRQIKEILNVVDTEEGIARQAIETALQSQGGSLMKKVIANNMSGGAYHPRLFDSVDDAGRSLRRKAIVDRGKRTPESAIAAGHVLPRMAPEFRHAYSMEDLDVLETLAGRHIRQVEDARRKLTTAAQGSRAGGYLTVKRLSANTAAEFYANNAATTYALFIQGRRADGTLDPAVWDDITRVQKEQQRYVEEAQKKGLIEGDAKLYNTEWSPQNKSVLSETAFGGNLGYWTPADVINQSHSMIANNDLRGVVRDVIVPSMLGRQSIKHSTENLMVHTAAMGTKVAASMLKNFGADKTDMGKAMISKMENFSDAPRSYVAAGTNGSLARYLYITHLGYNPASVAMNMTQPWLLGASMLGIGPIIKGYGKAFKELGSYMSDRIQSGKVFISDREKAKLIKDKFSFADHLGISPDAFRTLDETLMTVGQEKNIGLWDRVANAGMKMFEKGEWMNRLVIAHAVDDLYKTTGATKRMAPGQKIKDVTEMIQETQFGADYLNTPMAFMGAGALGQWFARPEMRQFLTFPVRSLTGVLVSSKQLNEGRRSVFGVDIPFPRTVDFIRGMGISSMLYYTGRNMFEADMSKSLFYNSMTDIVAGDPFNDYENATDFIPVPPVIDLGWDAIRGVTTGDQELLANSLFRAVPGGVQLSRAFATGPKALGLPSDNPLGRLVGGFQKRYAAYDMITQENQVPIFKGDGTFVEFRSPMQVVLQGLGMDLKASSVRSEETGYYVKQREMILGYRQEILSRMLANDIPGAMRKKAEYEKRMKIPFSITKDQLRQFLKNRQIPRNERILDRIPPEARNLYSKYVAADMINKDVDPSVFVDAPTSTARSEIMGRPRTFDLQAEAVKAMEDLLRQSEEAKRLSEMGYTGFGSFRD